MAKRTIEQWGWARMSFWGVAAGASPYLSPQVFLTRTDVIEHWGRKWWRRKRRRGEVRAVKVRMIAEIDDDD